MRLKRYRYFDKVTNYFKYSERDTLDFLMDAGNTLDECDEYTGLKDTQAKDSMEEFAK